MIVYDMASRPLPNNSKMQFLFVHGKFMIIIFEKLVAFLKLSVYCLFYVDFCFSHKFFTSVNKFW